MNEIPYIDSHQHFWKFDPVRESWIKDEMSVIQKDFYPVDLELLLKQNGFAGSVVVQSDQSEKENVFHLHNAEQAEFIKGIVGWVDLQANSVEERLAFYSGFSKMKGFRHVLQGESDRSLMLKPAFMRGIGLLEKFRFSYDILIYHDQLKYIPEFVSAFPHQKFVIDHIAKPQIKDGIIHQWKKDMEELACFENVYCKISGMVTEANWQSWKVEDFYPYLDVIVNTFGIKRIMYGSDWPVCLVAASYEKMLGIVKKYFSSFTAGEKDAFFGGNASLFYHL